MPRDEAELRSAIREIERSTEAIAAQAETLRLQREALARFARGRIDAEGRREEVAARRGGGLAGGVRGEKAKVSCVVCYPTCHVHLPLLRVVMF